MTKAQLFQCSIKIPHNVVLKKEKNFSKNQLLIKGPLGINKANLGHIDGHGNVALLIKNSPEGLGLLRKPTTSISANQVELATGRVLTNQGLGFEKGKGRQINPNPDRLQPRVIGKASHRCLYLCSYSKSIFRTFHSLLTNQVSGVTRGFMTFLRISGIGYRCMLENRLIQPGKNGKLLPLQDREGFSTPKPCSALAQAKGVDPTIIRSMDKAVLKNQAAQTAVGQVSRSTKLPPVSQNVERPLTNPEKLKSRLLSDKRAIRLRRIDRLGHFRTKIDPLLSPLSSAAQRAGSELDTKQNSRSPSVFQAVRLKVGFSHDLLFVIPESIKCFLIEGNLLCFYGVNKNQVTQLASKIRAIQPPSIYKGKGIAFSDEVIKLKQGKRK